MEEATRHFCNRAGCTYRLSYEKDPFQKVPTPWHRHAVWIGSDDQNRHSGMNCV